MNSPVSIACASERFASAPRYALWFSVLLVFALLCFGQSRLYYDYAWQLMSVSDHTAGITDSPFVVRSADPHDLSRDRTEWTIGYPLGYNATGAVLAATGLPLAQVHRLIGALAILLGIFGWHRVFADCLSLSPLLRAIALLAVSLSYNGVPMLAFMMPETFLFATVPWQIWAIHRATEAELPPTMRLRLCALLGVVTGAAYVFRYLAALPGLALLACVALWLVTHRPAAWIRCGLVAAMAAALPVAAMSAFNYAHLGAINSVSDRLPWGVGLHWPGVNQWLLVTAGSYGALFGCSLVVGRAGEFLSNHFFHLGSYDSLQALQFLLMAVPAALSAALLARFAPRDRLLGFALAVLAVTGGGLLWIYGRSSIPQTDPRYLVSPALMFFPSGVLALLAALRSSASWRWLAILVCAPLFLALVLAIYSMALSLRAAEPGGRRTIAPGGRIDPPALQASVRAQLAVPSDEIVWMCFQPGVLQALGGRHAFESYLGLPVDYRSARPLTLVILRDKGRGMGPTIYDNNYHYLDIAGHPPEFEYCGYDVFLRRIGPEGLIRVSPARP